MSIIQGMPQKIHTRPKRFSSWVEAILLILLMAFIFSGIILVPFHADEAAYIYMSGDYDVIVKQGNPGAFLLNKEASDQGMRLSIGSILGFSIGLARDVTDMGGSLNNNWDWGYTWSENIQQGNMPNHQLLTLARACSALMGALSIFFFFLTTRQLLGSRLPAWVAAILLATHGGILVHFRCAMQEGPKFLFLTITLYLASRTLRGLKNGRVHISIYVLLGLASGLTLAAKQDTVPMLLAIYLALALVPVWQKETGRVILVNILDLGAATTLALASFLALTPIFWGWWETVFVLAGFATLLFQIPPWNVNKAAKPLALAGCALIVSMTAVSPSLWYRVHIPFSKMMEVRKVIIGGQVDYLMSNNLFYLNTFENKARFLLTSIVTSSVASSAMYMDSTNLGINPIDEQIAIYEASYLDGRIDTPILDALIVILFAVGIRVLFRRFSMESLLIFSLLFITTAVLFVSIPLPWQRYFLILQIPYSMIAGAGAAEIWTWGTTFLDQRTERKKLKTKNLPLVQEQVQRVG